MKPIEILEQTIPPHLKDELAKADNVKQAYQQQAMAAARVRQQAKTLNLTKIQQLLPNIDQAKLKTALTARAAGRTNNSHLITLGQVFNELLSTDPKTTNLVTAELKKAQNIPVSATQPVKEGILDTARAIGSGIQSAYKGAQKSYAQSQQKSKIQAIVDVLIKNYPKYVKLLDKKYLPMNISDEAKKQYKAKELANFIFKSLNITQKELSKAEKLQTANKSITREKRWADFFVKMIKGGLESKILQANNSQGTISLDKEFIKLIQALTIIRQLPSDTDDELYRSVVYPTTDNGTKLISKNPVILRYKDTNYEIKNNKWIDITNNVELKDPVLIKFLNGQFGILAKELSITAAN